MTDIGKRFLNISQLSAKIGNRSRSSIYRDVEEKRIPSPIRIGGRPYWEEADIDAALLQLKEQEAA